MTINDVRLALLACAQRWQPGRLDANVLLVPSGDPTQPLFPATPGTAPFAGAGIRLRVAAVPGLDAMPALTAASQPLTLTRPADAASLFARLAAQFTPQDTTVSPPLPIPPRSVLRKALPGSYLALLPPGGDRSPFAASIEEFGCTLRSQQVQSPPLARPNPAWGEIISHALRNPVLATALGLRYTFPVPIADATPFASGGWLFVTLDGADGGTGYAAAWAGAPDAVRVYAARLPALLGRPRAVFTAVLFPVTNPAAPPQTPDEAALDEAVIEAEAYDDGFAKLVHARQPDSNDAHTGDDSIAVNAATDVGIQIGWDDEQVLTWHNRQTQIAQSVLTGDPVPLESPLGVQGYRIDVREPAPDEPPGQNTGWVTLMQATGTPPPPPLGSGVDTFAGELLIEPTASAPADLAGRPGEFWLPLYFAQWQGTPIGVRDDTPHLLAGGVAAGLKNPVVPSAFVGADVPALLYGHSYEVRVRLGDPAGGGPTVHDLPINETTSERARVDFARYVSPNAFRLPIAANGPDITLTRPAIGYPQALFTTRYGARPDIRTATRSAMLAQLGLGPDGSPLPAGQRVSDSFTVGVPDPDVSQVEIRVEVRALAHDTGDEVAPDGVFTTLYVATRPVPPLPPLPDAVTPADVIADVAIDNALDFVDAADATTLTPPPDGPLPIPRARDIRLVFTPIASGPPGYFGTVRASQAARSQPTRGARAHLAVRAKSADEASPLLAPPEGARPPAQAYFFQPATSGDPAAAMMRALAERLGVDADGLTLQALPGQRVVFGAAAGVACTIGSDGSSLTFAAAADLFRTWTIGLTYDLARDWTWDGLAQDQVTVSNGGTTIGTITVPRIASRLSLSGTPDRTRTRLIFVDRIDPAVPNPMDGFSDRPPYQLSAAIPTDGGQLERTTDPIALRLPVVVPPAGVPRLTSAGYALSPYQAAADYSSTTPRTRQLWLELEQPPAPGDAVFARILAYAPDPLLYVDPDVLAAPPPDDPPLRLDPESIRVITPGQPRDDDGLEAMIQLTPATGDPTRFLLPLPDGIAADDPRLFGLWTYELRYGHLAPWSTAHGRYSHPLRITGIQHPAPALPCAASWRPSPATAGPGNDLVATAPYAIPVLNGRQVGTGAPCSTLGFLLYAQALQSDRSSDRNVLIGHSGATRVNEGGRVIFGTATFTHAAVGDALTGLGLPAESPLSVLAVEFYSAGGSVGFQYLQRPPEPAADPDPFGSDLFGRRRILRTSPLAPVQPVC